MNFKEIKCAIFGHKWSEYPSDILDENYYCKCNYCGIYDSKIYVSQVDEMMVKDLNRITEKICSTLNKSSPWVEIIEADESIHIKDNET